MCLRGSLVVAIETVMQVYVSSFLVLHVFVVFHHFRFGGLKEALAKSIAVDVALDQVDHDR